MQGEPQRNDFHIGAVKHLGDLGQSIAPVERTVRVSHNANRSLSMTSKDIEKDAIATKSDF